MSWRDPIESIVVVEGADLHEMIEQVAQGLPAVAGRTWVVHDVKARLDLIDVSGGRPEYLPGPWKATITAIALEGGSDD